MIPKNQLLLNVNVNTVTNRRSESRIGQSKTFYDLQQRLVTYKVSTEIATNLSISLKDAINHCELQLNDQQHNHELESQTFHTQIAALLSSQLSLHFKKTCD